MADNTFLASEGIPSPWPEQSEGALPRLSLQGISKSFGAVRALTDVDFEVYPGEVVGLVGDNGAGKSTLIKVIAGVISADSGDIFIDGQPVKISSPQAAVNLGIETVYQDLALCDNLDVVANLFLGHETPDRPHSVLMSWKNPASIGLALGHFLLKVTGLMDEVTMEKQSLEVLHTLNVKIPSTRTPVSSLSGGQRQSIAVAKTILRQARVILLDEPTAALGVAQTQQVLSLIKRLREQGLAVVIISHNLADVFEVVDRVIVLRLGRRVGTFDIKSTTPERIVASITGAEFGELLSAEEGNENGNGQYGGK